MAETTQGAYLEFHGPDGFGGHQYVHAMGTSGVGEKWVLGFLPFPPSPFVDSGCRWFLNRISRWDYGWKLEGWSARSSRTEDTLLVRPMSDPKRIEGMRTILAEQPEDLMAHLDSELDMLCDIRLLI